MSIEGVDFSFARPGGAALVAAGKKFVVRYVSGSGTKALTKAEVNDYLAHGLAIALVFESTANRALSGNAAGIADATNAVAACQNLGIPQTVPIYFAVDFDAQPGQQTVIDAYLKGAASVLGLARVGVYGGIRVVTRCHTNGTARWFWQTYAWSAGQIAPFIHLYQYRNGQRINGGAVDFCRAYRANYGQWPQPIVPSNYRVSIHPKPGFKGYPKLRTFGLYTVINGRITGRTSAQTGGFSADCTAPRIYPGNPSRRLVRLTSGSRKGQYVLAMYATEKP